MRLCFIADLNSIHSRKFIRFFPPRGHEVLVLSTTRFAGNEFSGARVINLPAEATGGAPPAVLAAARRALTVSHSAARRALGDRLARVRSIATPRDPDLYLRAIQRTIERDLARGLEQRMLFYETHRARVRELVHDFHPDLLQCLRLPVEGYLGACAEYHPTLHFCWGNDLTLYASRYPRYGERTREALSRCAAFLTDCRRDARLAPEWGLPRGTPTLVTPGGGGLETDAHEHHPDEDATAVVSAGASPVASDRLGAEGATAWSPEPARDGPGRAAFLTLRGLGGRYTDNLPVIRAIPLLLGEVGDRLALRFAGSTVPYGALLRTEAHRLGVERFLEFLGRVEHARIPELIVRNRFVFSATYHDGTPNSMLETMWYGGIPICSDLESIREWIVDGENGYFFDMRDPASIAAAFARALREEGRHDDFRRRNRALIRERADYRTCMGRVLELYERIVAGGLGNPVGS
ncbi:MAG: glycosyltransferase [Candidatus Eisenbacteria bacterium]